MVRLGLDKEISPDGTYLTYFPFGLMIERPRMAAYHNKLSDEGLVCCSIKKTLNLCRVGHLDLYQPTLTIWVFVYE